MFENLKSKIKKKSSGEKKYTLSKRDAAIGITVLLALATSFSLADYNPGQIVYQAKGEVNKAAPIGEFSKSDGPVFDLEVMEKEGYGNKTMKRDIEPPPLTSQTPSLPFYDQLPSSMPSFSGSGGRTPAQSQPKFNPSMVYAKHSSITNGMRDILNPLFKLEKMSEAPKGRERKFGSVYAISKNGNISERVEVMSIVRTDSMTGIKTAKNALESLVEESNAVNILEDKDSYLIYDFAGSKGYQIGKIAVDNEGIYILGYVNLTTNDMPYSLKFDWMNKIRGVD